MRKLLATGRTDLLKDFVSARTRRKFSAFLVRSADGKVGFEFEKREPKTKASTKSAAADTQADGGEKGKASTKATARKKMG
jgi:DNA topoisomerase-3